MPSSATSPGYGSCTAKPTQANLCRSHQPPLYRPNPPPQTIVTANSLPLSRFRSLSLSRFHPPSRPLAALRSPVAHAAFTGSQDDKFSIGSACTGNPSDTSGRRPASGIAVRHVGQAFRPKLFLRVHGALRLPHPHLLSSNTLFPKTVPNVRNGAQRGFVCAGQLPDRGGNLPDGGPG